MMEYIFESRYRHFACKNLESITIVILSMVPVVGLEPTRVISSTDFEELSCLGS